MQDKLEDNHFVRIENFQEYVLTDNEQKSGQILCSKNPIQKSN